jgi:aspartate dehydrogenase
MQTVAIAGLGAIGKELARRLTTQGGIPGLSLVAAGARDEPKARAFLDGIGAGAVAIAPLGRLGALADIVVEVLPSAAFDELAEPTLRAGRTLVVVSVGALLDRPGLRELAERHGGKIVVPTGALLGLDAVRAAAEGDIRSVKMITRKPPDGLKGAPHLEKNRISVDGLKAPLKVFAGTAREAVRGFPANVNVAAALSLAGIGPDRTTIEIWADPGVDRNRHRIEVDADSAWFALEIANVPSENPKTGRITALSVVALLRRLGSSFQIGT